MNECCKDEKNLKVVETRPIKGGTITVRQCQVCERKHYEVVAEPIELNAQGKGL